MALREQLFWFSRTQVLIGLPMISQLFKVFNKTIQALQGSSIPYSVHFDGRPTLPHGLQGVFISNDAKIGRNVTILHQVTIGSKATKGSKFGGSPTIEDNCFIGAGAKIIGPITVGSGARIGANAVIVKDVPPNSTVFLRTESLT